MFGKTTAFAPGMTVVCIDNDQAPFLTRGTVYTVREVSHQGALVQVGDAQGMYAAVRFMATTPTTASTQPEYANARG